MFELADMTMTLASETPAAVAAAPWWIMLIPGLPMLGVLLCTLMAMGGVRSKAPAWITVACLGASFILTVFMYAGHEPGWSTVVAWDWISISWGDGPGQTFNANFAFAVDGLTILWMLFVTGLATLIALYASEYMSPDVGQGYNRFFMAFNLFVFSMACLVMGSNLLMLYLGWEGVGLCSYLLIGYYYKKPSAVAAAKKAFIVNRIGDFGLALGVYLTFVHFGTLEYTQLFADEKLTHYLHEASTGNFAAIPWQASVIPLLLMVGAFGKSAQLPLYVWLPDAMEGPTPVSALIHAATMVTAGVYLIARTMPLFEISEYALPIVAWVGTLTALLAATIGMAQFDIKRIMAYSTVSQLGYMFAGLGVMTSVGAGFHVLTHAFFKALLFLACGAVMHGFAGQLDLRKLSGLWKVPGWRIVTIGMLVGCLNLSGFPLTAGFFSKDMIIAESFVTAGPGYAAIGWILLLTAGLTAYYTFRVFFRVFVGPKEFEPGDELHDDHGDDGHEFHPHAPGWAVNTVLGILALASIAAAGTYFIYTKEHGWVGHMVHDSSANFIGAAAFLEVAGHGEEAAHGTFLGMDPHKAMYFVSAIVGFIGIGAAFVLHYLGRTTAATSKADALLPMMGPIARWAQGKWFVDEFYNAVIVLPLRVLSHVFHTIDRLFVDGLVNFAGVLPRFVGARLRPWQNGVLQGYAVGMAGGLAVLIAAVVLLSN